MSAKLRGSLHVKSDQSLSGVTSLRDKIYIAIGSKVIIYEAEAPYRRLEKTIKVPGIRMIDSVEVVSCTVNNCLYINDPDTDAIWKVNPANDHELTKWLSNLNDIKVSTSSRGEVFVLDTNHSCPTVSIYTEDAVLQRSVPLPLRTAAYSIRSAAVEIMPEVVAVSFVFGDGNKIREGIVVARLNETGQVLREVEWRGLSNLTPHSLGRFIAADGSSQRLILLDYQLYPVQVIPMSNESGVSQWPRILCYRREKRELVVDHVGHADDYQLDMYRLNYDDELDA